MAEFISKEELEKRYAGFNDEKILNILANKADYTPTAIEVANKEFIKRQLNLQYLAEETKKIEEAKKESIENKELNLFSKLLYYIFSFTGVGFIVAYLNRKDYKEKGSLKKSTQVIYYSATGFVFIIICILYSLLFNYNGNYLFPILLSFIAFLLLENWFMNKNQS